MTARHPAVLDVLGNYGFADERLSVPRRAVDRRAGPAVAPNFSLEGDPGDRRNGQRRGNRVRPNAIDDAVSVGIVFVVAAVSAGSQRTPRVFCHLFHLSDRCLAHGVPGLRHEIGGPQPVLDGVDGFRQLRPRLLDVGSNFLRTPLGRLILRCIRALARRGGVAPPLVQARVLVVHVAFSLSVSIVCTGTKLVLRIFDKPRLTSTYPPAMTATATIRAASHAGIPS